MHLVLYIFTYSYTVLIGFNALWVFSLKTTLLHTDYMTTVPKQGSYNRKDFRKCTSDNAVTTKPTWPESRQTVLAWPWFKRTKNI